MNTEKLTRKTLDALQTAQSMAQENQNQYLTPEHLLYALVDQDGGLIPSLLGRMGVDCDQLLSELDTRIGQLPPGIRWQRGRICLPGNRPGAHPPRRRPRPSRGTSTYRWST